MDIVDQLEQMKEEGKKVVSIDYVIKELRGIPPTRQQKTEDVPRIDFYSILGSLPAEGYKKSNTRL